MYAGGGDLTENIDAAGGIGTVCQKERPHGKEKSCLEKCVERKGNLRKLLRRSSCNPSCRFYRCVAYVLRGYAAQAACGQTSEGSKSYRFRGLVKSDFRDLLCGGDRMRDPHFVTQCYKTA